MLKSIETFSAAMKATGLAKMLLFVTIEGPGRAREGEKGGEKEKREREK